MPNVVTYCRVSSEEQALKDISIPAQRKLLRQWVDAQLDHAVLADFVDEGQSAYAPADKRPGFCEMVSYCRKHDVDLILVHKLDRFSRNREESILFKGLLRKHGVTVKSITENYDPETPQGFLYEGMIEVINQFYSMNLATETIKGMRENAERGFVNGGRIPYGYRLEKVADRHGREHGKLVLGPENEVETVRTIFDLAANQGMGGKSLAGELNRRGIPAPRTKHWSPATIAHILSNPVYVGDQVWFRSKKQGRDGRTRTETDAHIVTPNAHPAIVDRETFEKRKQMATTRRFDATPNPEHHVNYLLSRLIRCESCGGSFVGRRHYYSDRQGNKHVRHAYYCSSYLTKGTAVCRSLPIDRDWVEQYVVDQIRQQFDDERWSQLVAASNARIEARRSRYLNDGKAVAQKVGDIDRRIQNYVRAIGDGLDPAMCSAQIAELNAQKAKLEEEAALLRKEDYYARAVEKNLEQLERLRRIATTDFARLPFGLQRQFVTKFLQALDVKADRRTLDARFQVPFDNQGIQLLAAEAEEALERGARNDDGPPEEDGPTGSIDDASPEGSADGRYGTKWLPSLYDRGNVGAARSVPAGAA